MNIFTLSSLLLSLASSSSITVEGEEGKILLTELVTSGLFANLQGIGYGKGQLSPKDYLSLYKQDRILNFRGLWLEWCESLQDPGVYKASLAEIGEDDFWDIVDGECLSIGALRWMTPDDVKEVHCAHLMNVPKITGGVYGGSNRKYIPIPDYYFSEENVVAEIEKTLEFDDAYDSFGYLSNMPRRAQAVIGHFKNVLWNDRKWLIFSKYFATDDESFQMFLGMLPPADIQDTSSNLQLILIRTVLFLENISLSDRKNQIDIILAKNNEQSRHLESFIESLKTTPLDCLRKHFVERKNLSMEEVGSIFELIPADQPRVRLAWLDLNMSTLKHRELSKLHIWRKEFPKNYPDLPIFTFTSKAIFLHDSAPIPYYMLALLGKYRLNEQSQKAIPSYSLVAQAEFVAWYYRRPEFIRYEPCFMPCHLAREANFGYIRDRKHSFDEWRTEEDLEQSKPMSSLEYFLAQLTKLKRRSERENVHWNTEYIYTVLTQALYYGFKICTNSSSTVRDFILEESKYQSFSYPFEFISSKYLKNLVAFLLSQDVISDSFSPSEPSIAENVHLCHKLLNNLTVAQLESITPVQLSLYFRETLRKTVPFQARQCRSSLRNLSEEQLIALFSEKCESEQLQMLETIKTVFVEEEDKDFVDGLDVIITKSKKREDKRRDERKRIPKWKQPRRNVEQTNEQPLTYDDKPLSDDDKPLTNNEAHFEESDQRQEQQQQEQQAPGGNNQSDRSDNVIFWTLIVISSIVVVGGTYFTIKKRRQV